MPAGFQSFLETDGAGATKNAQTKGPRQPGSQLIFGPLQSGSDFLSSDREFRMITLVREHFGRYGNCVVADTKWPYDFTNGNGLPGVNANLGYVANRFSVAGDERQSDKAFVYLRRCWMLLADDLRCSRRCPNKQDNKRNYGCFRHGFVSFRHVFSSQLLFQAPGSAIFNGICLAITFHCARTPLTRSRRDPRCSHGPVWSAVELMLTILLGLFGLRFDVRCGITRQGRRCFG
jgi:hypothetical protein